MNAARAVRLVAWANLKGQRLQAGLIALTLAACGALLTVGLAAQAASGSAFDRLWRATNGPDLWFYLDATKVDPVQIKTALGEAAGVARWTGPLPQARVAPAGLPQTGFASGFVLRDWPSDSSSLGHPLLVAGRAPNPGERGVIVLDRNVAAQSHLVVGQSFSIPTPTGIDHLRIVGLEASAENCPYPMCSPQPLYLARGGLAQLGLAPGGSGGQYAVAIRATRAAHADLDRLRDEITGRLPPGSVSFSGPISSVRQFSQLGYEAQSGLLVVFSAAAAATAGLLIVVAVGAAVRADSRRIGLLKAVGFAARQLRAAALVEYVGLGLVGAAAGATVAALAAPHLLASVTQQFGAAGSGAPWGDGLLAVAAVTGLNAVVVLWAVRRAVHLPPVVALRSHAGGGQGVTALLRGPVVVSRALGDLVAGRGRTLLTAATLGLAGAALVLAALFSSSLDQFLHTGLAFDGARTGDLIALGPDRPRDLGVLRSQPGVAGVVWERFATFSLVGSSQTLNVRLRDGDTAVLAEPLVSGRELRRPGEILVGYGLAHSHHVELGEELPLVVGGAVRQFRVVGINREASNLGQMVTTLPQSVAGLENVVVPPLYLVRVRPGIDPAALARHIHLVTGGLINPTVAGVSSLPPLIGSAIPLTKSLAAALAFLTALGVFNAVMLSVQERRREFGLVRALGMERRQVLGISLLGVAVLAAAACLVAVPVATVAGRMVIGMVMSQVGIGHLAPPLSGAVLAVGPVVVLIALLGAVGPAWSASRTSAVAVLRAE